MPVFFCQKASPWLPWSGFHSVAVPAYVGWAEPLVVWVAPNPSSATMAFQMCSAGWRVPSP